ncbi:MAG TPA: cell division protein ZapA [Caulobacterales bacterium]|nr:cell division protein ZapA [Caulobacterales bacterium]
MAHAVLRVLGQELSVECAPDQVKRLEDLAAALEARLERFPHRRDGERLILAALALLDEAQAAGAALVRARNEIDRLADLLTEAKTVKPMRAPETKPLLNP